MPINKDPTAQKLLQAFSRLKRLHWHQSSIAGLTPSEILVLFCVKKRMTKGVGLKISEISRYLKVAAPTITQQINTLENRGYVERSTDEQDRRAVRIKLTAAGEKVITRASDDFFTSFNGLVAYLGEDQSKQLVELLSKVFTYFNEAAELNAVTPIPTGDDNL